jgi:hypothetical protein
LGDECSAGGDDTGDDGRRDIAADEGDGEGAEDRRRRRVDGDVETPAVTGGLVVANGEAFRHDDDPVQVETFGARSDALNIERSYEGYIYIEEVPCGYSQEYSS